MWAPQYPEGLEIKIWLSKVTGDLANINLLNHYIGMHKIEPDEIPELKYFIYVFSVIVVLGVATSAIGKRKLLYIFSVLFILFSLGALYDFYAWEYRYGHDLSPDAAIKTEGATYQPPLIGKKEIMNIEASSYPAQGGTGHILSLVLVVTASGLEFWNSRKNRRVA